MLCFKEINRRFYEKYFLGILSFIVLAEYLVLLEPVICLDMPWRLRTGSRHNKLSVAFNGEIVHYGMLFSVTAGLVGKILIRES